MRGPALLELLGEETLQWFTTKFNTWSGILQPYFVLEAEDGKVTTLQHRNIIQMRPLSIVDALTCKNLERVHQWRDLAKRQLASLKFCRAGGHASKQLCKVRPKLMDKIKHTFHNNVIGILRHYLCNI